VLRSRVHALCHAPWMRGEGGKSQKDRRRAVPRCRLTCCRARPGQEELHPTKPECCQSWSSRPGFGHPTTLCSSAGLLRDAENVSASVHAARPRSTAPRAAESKGRASARACASPRTRTLLPRLRPAGVHGLGSTARAGAQRRRRDGLPASADPRKNARRGRGDAQTRRRTQGRTHGCTDARQDEGTARNTWRNACALDGRAPRRQTHQPRGSPCPPPAPPPGMRCGVGATASLPTHAAGCRAPAGARLPPALCAPAACLH
jgi:hypothetical protein